VTCESLEELGDLAAPQVTLRYALLSLLGVIIPRAQGNRVTLAARPASGGAVLTVAAMNPGDAGLSERERASLEMARQLADLAGGQLDLDFTRDGCAARLTLPLLARIPVLVVDDNADTLHLFNRYVTGTRFCLTSTHRPEAALRLAVELAPRIVVLDVMMPGIDGWEVLTRLRAHPTMANTALIVCTVLPQEELALALGADGFLQKPVTREAFLAMLERHSAIT
jgi:CheY-like chemotaxis protein